MVFLTMIFAWARLDKSDKTHFVLLSILLLSTITEIINSIFELMDESVRLTTTISIILHDILWLVLLRDVTGRKMLGNIALIAFATFALTNLALVEGTSKFNFATFVLGALLYVVIFLYHSTIKLRNEEFSFFIDNSFLVVFAPVIFFVGLAMLFSFQNFELHYTNVLGIKMWDWIIYFVNIIYYSILNIYIYRQRRIAYDI